MKETDAILKAIADGLKIMAKGIEAVAEQVSSLAQPENKTKPKTDRKKATKARAAKKPVKKPAEKKVKQTAAKGKKLQTATDTVMAVIQKAEGPVDNSQISADTGFDTKKVANLLFQLKKQGRIKNAERGKYVAA